MRYKMARQIKEDCKETGLTSTLKLCVLFKQFGKLEVEVICFLDGCVDAEFLGNYSELTRRMNHPDADIPNVTKAVKRLEKRGMLTIWKNALNDRSIQAISLNLYWDMKLLKGENYND